VVKPASTGVSNLNGLGWAGKTRSIAMASLRRTILRGKEATLQEVTNGSAVGYFVNAKHPGLKRSFDDRAKAEAHFRAVEDGTANPDLP
jgi:hypothetical protein